MNLEVEPSGTCCGCMLTAEPINKITFNDGSCIRICVFCFIECLPPEAMENVKQVMLSKILEDEE